jgi:hypothetical protein
MNRFGKLAVCLAGGLALNAGLRAAEPAPASNPLPDNPYGAIATRNIFGLIPPAPPENPTNELEKQLPKITPTGIMGVFGNEQVLFKVAAAAAAKPGPPAKDEYYILSEGQRQDDIEVLKIDDKKSLVTFDNHGFTQELPLANTSASGGSGGPAAAASPGGMNPGMAPRPPGGGGMTGPGGFTRFGGAPAGDNGGMANSNPGFNGGPGNPNDSMNNGMNFGSSASPNRNYQPMQDNPPTSAESQIIQMEYNRAVAQQKGDPQAFLIPPTPITEFNK